MSRRNPSGAVHPTIFLVAWFVAGFGLQRLWPLELPSVEFLGPLRLGLLLVAAVLFGWSVLELRKRGTTIEHKNPTTALATGGPYGLTRHPIYYALILILAAVAIDAKSLWFILLTLAFWGAVHRFTVLREEAYLERQFGEEYVRYKRTVRQWL